MTINTKYFAKTLLDWFDQHGRKHLPWQQHKTAYRVWISEIMLQQTQVATVIPYFERFIKLFPDVATLAQATEDAVLHLWAGLGYYSRARNLHRAAKTMLTQHRGNVPSTLPELIKLPGIGLSTAGAILSIAYKQPVAILDGNVKRVLARLHAIDSPIDDKQIENKLWELARNYTPIKRVADYTQAMMDFGATLCTRKNPQCVCCPFQKYCAAYQQNIVNDLPKKKASKILPLRVATFLIFKNNEHLLLEKRPSYGIWGGLWSFPEISGKPEKKAIRLYCHQKLHFIPENYELMKSFRHTFTHYHLDIHPIIINTINTSKNKQFKVMDDCQQIWYNPSHPENIGLPKPVQIIIKALS